MRLIEIWTEILPKAWRWHPEHYLGGTPEFYVNTAISIKGADVCVYYDGPPVQMENVFFLPRTKIRGDDVILHCNHVAPKMGKHNIYWTNWIHRRQKDVMDFDERIVLSPFHKHIFGENSRIVPHSCWPEKFKGGVKKPKQCLFSSSPDRGRVFLENMWDEVKERCGADLITTYRKEISEDQMTELYKESQFWLHPGEGVELCCIAAIKAQAAGCIPIYGPSMALATTVKYGVETDHRHFKEDLINAVNNPPAVKEVDFGSWETVTAELFKNI